MITSWAGWRKKVQFLILFRKDVCTQFKMPCIVSKICLKFIRMTSSSKDPEPNPQKVDIQRLVTGPGLRIY
jgi:hypothetical protein